MEEGWGGGKLAEDVGRDVEVEEYEEGFAVLTKAVVGGLPGNVNYDQYQMLEEGLTKTAVLVDTREEP